MINFDNYFLPVDDLERAMDYYQNILGFEKTFDFSNEGMVAYSVGDEEPSIILKDKRKFKDIKPTVWFVVDDVKEEYKKLIEKGVNFITPPFRIKTGFAAEFEDPFGNRLGIADYKSFDSL